MPGRRGGARAWPPRTLRRRRRAVRATRRPACSKEGSIGAPPLLRSFSDTDRRRRRRRRAPVNFKVLYMTATRGQGLLCRSSELVPTGDPLRPNHNQHQQRSPACTTRICMCCAQVDGRVVVYSPAACSCVAGTSARNMTNPHLLLLLLRAHSYHTHFCLAPKADLLRLEERACVVGGNFFFYDCSKVIQIQQIRSKFSLQR
jgi:hypothetical protein